MLILFGAVFVSSVKSEELIVLNYTMDEMGDYARDSSIFSNSGELFNVHLVNDGLRKGYWFSEGDSTIMVQNSDTLGFDKNGIYVWDFYIKPLDFDRTMMLVSKSTSYIGGYDIRITSDNKLMFVSGKTWGGYITDDSLSFNRWQRITVEYNKGAVKIYINGSQKNLSIRGNVQFDNDYSNDLYLSSPSEEVFNGYMDDIKIYSNIISTVMISGVEDSSEIKMYTHVYSGISDIKAAQELAIRYDTIVTQNVDGKYIDAMKQVNPDLKVLLYKTSFLCDNPSTVHESITGFNDAQSDWFMKTTTGGFVKDNYDGGTHNCYMMDYGNSGWQEFYATKVLDELRANRFDGLWMDVLSLQPQGNYIGPTEQLQGYRDLREYQVAVLEFLDYVNNQLNYYTLTPNLAEAVTVDDTYYNFGNTGKDVWNALLDVTDGGTDESFIMVNWWSPSLKYRPADQVMKQLIAHEDSTEKNKYYLAFAQIGRGSCNDGDLRYSLASYLLGVGANSYFNPQCITEMSYNSAIINYNSIKNYLDDVKCGQALGQMNCFNNICSRSFEKCYVEVDILSHTGLISVTGSLSLF